MNRLQCDENVKLDVYKETSIYKELLDYLIYYAASEYLVTHFIGEILSKGAKKFYPGKVIFTKKVVYNHIAKDRDKYYSLVLKHSNNPLRAVLGKLLKFACASAYGEKSPEVCISDKCEIDTGTRGNGNYFNFFTMAMVKKDIGNYFAYRSEHFPTATKLKEYDKSSLISAKLNEVEQFKHAYCTIVFKVVVRTAKRKFTIYLQVPNLLRSTIDSLNELSRVSSWTHGHVDWRQVQIKTVSGSSP